MGAGPGVREELWDAGGDLWGCVFDCCGVADLGEEVEAVEWAAEVSDFVAWVVGWAWKGVGRGRGRLWILYGAYFVDINRYDLTRYELYECIVLVLQIYFVSKLVYT